MVHPRVSCMKYKISFDLKGPGVYFKQNSLNLNAGLQRDFVFSRVSNIRAAALKTG